jgi:hypothetical protein
MHVTHGPDPNHVGKSDARVGMLASPGFPAQLHDDFSDLADSSWPDRMAHCDESSRGIHGAHSADIKRTLLEQSHLCVPKTLSELLP